MNALPPRAQTPGSVLIEYSAAASAQSTALPPSFATSLAASAADCEVLGVDASNPPALYRAVGCAECNHLGYKGRTGIYELVGIDDEMRTRIHDGDGEQKLEAHARQYSPSMRQDGWRRVLAGETTVEEVLRVSQEG